MSFSKPLKHSDCLCIFRPDDINDTEFCFITLINCLLMTRVKDTMRYFRVTRYVMSLWTSNQVRQYLHLVSELSLFINNQKQIIIPSGITVYSRMICQLLGRLLKYRLSLQDKYPQNFIGEKAFEMRKNEYHDSMTYNQ